MFFFHGKGSFVKIFHIQILQHMCAGYITEKSDFILNTLIQRYFAAAYDDIRLDSHSLQLLYAGLCGLCFQLLGSAQIRN